MRLCNTVIKQFKLNMRNLRDSKMKTRIFQINKQYKQKQDLYSVQKCKRIE